MGIQQPIERGSQKRLSAYGMPLYLHLLLLLPHSGDDFLQISSESLRNLYWKVNSEATCFTDYSFVSLHLKISGTNKGFQGDRKGNHLYIYIANPKFILCNICIQFFIVLFLYQDFLLQYFSFLIRCHILEWFIPLWLLL